MPDTQLTLFDVSNIPQQLTAKDVANTMNVSVATIRNWVREDLLNKVDEKISLQDVESLMATKLKSRANKLNKDSHDHSVLCDSVQRFLAEGMNGSEISVKYEESLSESYKNKEGVYYTPQCIVSDMLKDIQNIGEKTFLDPCCGSGNFIVEAIKKGAKPENVYGFDIDPNAVKITQKRIFELTGYESNNILCVDFLAIANDYRESFDFIFTNPPWGKKLNKTEKERFSRIYQSGNSNDTCALFYFACLRVLRKGGRIGFLLPESFFNIGSFENARESLILLQINRLVDYGKPFKKLMTKAKAFVATKEVSNPNHTVSCESYEGNTFLRKQEGFKNIPKHIINFDVSENENEVLSQVFKKTHITLKNNAIWALGIVTGNNDMLFPKKIDKNYIQIFRGKDIFPDKVFDSGLYIEQSFKNCQQVAPLEYYNAKDKIIYRFISGKIVCFHDTEQRYILNSANLFILKDGFPVSYQQIVDLFNSDFMNWIFQKVFFTHKVLRGDLEMLPIWNEYFNIEKKFSEETLLDYLKIEKANGTYRVKK